jgi:hypothetical protein
MTKVPRIAKGTKRRVAVEECSDEGRSSDEQDGFLYSGQDTMVISAAKKARIPAGLLRTFVVVYMLVVRWRKFCRLSISVCSVLI